VVARRKRRVRIHLLDGRGQPGETVEGLQVGRRPIAGHYHLLMPKHLESEEHSNSLEGHLEVPADRVLFVQVLP
jgi:hypothetical protein